MRRTIDRSARVYLPRPTWPSICDLTPALSGILSVIKVVEDHSRTNAILVVSVLQKPGRLITHRLQVPGRWLFGLPSRTQLTERLGNEYPGTSPKSRLCGQRKEHCPLGNIGRSFSIAKCRFVTRWIVSDQ